VPPAATWAKGSRIHHAHVGAAETRPIRLASRIHPDVLLFRQLHDLVIQLYEPILFDALLFAMHNTSSHKTDMDELLLIPKEGTSGSPIIGHKP
jgi:hypothetical protein